MIRVDDFSGAGKSVITANPGDERFYYYHLDSYGEEIDEGDVLKVGDLIGYVGDTGNAAGGPAHLHFEIREDGDPKDPYPRITKGFSIQDKMEFLQEIMQNSSDEDELAEFLATNFLTDFIQARAQGIDLPETILDALPLSVAQAPSGVPQSDLSLGSSGTDVILLQSILIYKEFLSIPAPTGTFGPLTKAALSSYQSTAGLPATGYYGPLTRANLSSGSTSLGTMSREQILAQIAELTLKVQELQALIN